MIPARSQRHAVNRVLCDFYKKQLKEYQDWANRTAWIIRKELMRLKEQGVSLPEEEAYRLIKAPRRKPPVLRPAR